MNMKTDQVNNRPPPAQVSGFFGSLAEAGAGRSEEGKQTMVLSGEEMQLLEGLVGRKAEKVLVPIRKDSVSKPVETVLVLNNSQGVLIDSCYRKQKAVETPLGYPQMRVRLIEDIPHYANGDVIELSDSGEIVRAVHVTSEQVLTSEDTACYTKSVHIEFTGKREVTITRETFRSPALSVYEDHPDRPLETEHSARIIQTVQSF